MKYGLIIVGLLLMVSSASATDAWWDSSYQYRVPITLTGNTSGAQTNYQLLLNVSYDSNMQSDFDDLRFTDDSGNLQNAWLESKMDDSYVTVWVNFTSTPADGATQTYYMYYGNSEVSNYWNIETTFLFGDDFSESSLDTNKWTQIHGSTPTISNGLLTISADNHDPCKLIAKTAPTGDNYILRAYFKATGGTNTEERFGLSVKSDITTGEGYSYIFKDFTNLDEKYFLNEGVGWGDSTAFSWSKNTWYTEEIFYDGANVKGCFNDGAWYSQAWNGKTGYLSLNIGSFIATTVWDWAIVHKYVSNPPTYSFSSQEEYTLPAASETPAPTPTPLQDITSSNYVIQNQTLYITKPSDIHYKITSNSFVYGGLRNINTVICDNNNTVISGWFKISTDKEYDADYNFLINVNDTSYQSKIITLKQNIVDSSIISKTYKRTCLIDGYEIYSYNTTVYIVSILPNPIYFYFNLEDRIIQFGDKQFDNQTLVFNQLNFDDQYNFMGNASSDTVVMKFKAINPSVKSGAELKGLTGILINALSKIPFIGKSLKNILYYPLFFIQIIFNFIFTFLDIIVNDWWYALMTLEIVCIFSASRQKGYANVMEDYINTHVKIIKFIYEVIILNMINLIIKIVVTVKDMIKWW